jgi:hypothetical protein
MIGEWTRTVISGQISKKQKNFGTVYEFHTYSRWSRWGNSNKKLVLFFVWEDHLQKKCRLDLFRKRNFQKSVNGLGARSFFFNL